VGSAHRGPRFDGHGRGPGAATSGALALALVAGCAPDSVAPGYYGAADAGSATDAQPLAIEAFEAATLTAGDAAGGVAPAPPEGGADGATEAGLPETTVGCNLAGRWLLVDREVATALGAEEAAHEWLYFEMTQTGSDLTVTRGLACGQDVVGISAASANVDDHKVWPAFLTHVSETGRTGTSAAGGSGCSVSFPKFYEVLGATVAYYSDPGNPMPAPSDQATASSPGWEDWDGDGHPGFTMNVTGLATGQIYLATRRHNAWSGSIAAGANTFTLADDWNTEQDLLGYNGSSLLMETASGTRDNDATLHFVTFARLAPSQATGDDATTCAAVRMLAPTLAPKASN
jgi:hypothetical protein